MGPPIEHSGESNAGGPGGDAHSSLPTPFLTKTYQLVDDPTVDDVISWNDDGSTFVVWRPAEFARDILPKYFKHNNFSSFVRQLNTYGFRKIVPDRWEFANDCFKKGEKRLLGDIHRRKNPPAINVPANRHGSPTMWADEQNGSGSPAREITAMASHGTGATASEAVEENNKLRKENFHLRQELTQIKGLLDNIFTLMTKYANPAENGFDGDHPGRLPHLLPNSSPDTHDKIPDVKKEAATEEDTPLLDAAKEEDGGERSGSSSRLFGVTIRLNKRPRKELDVRGLAMKTKAEPLDSALLPTWDRYRCQSNGAN